MRGHLHALCEQKLFRGLRIPESVAGLGVGGLAALGALCASLARLKADQELATGSQQVRGRYVAWSLSVARDCVCVSR